MRFSARRSSSINSINDAADAELRKLVRSLEAAAGSTSQGVGFPATKRSSEMRPKGVAPLRSSRQELERAACHNSHPLSVLRVGQYLGLGVIDEIARFDGCSRALCLLIVVRVYCRGREHLNCGKRLPDLMDSFFERFRPRVNQLPSVSKSERSSWAVKSKREGDSPRQDLGRLGTERRIR